MKKTFYLLPLLVVTWALPSLTAQSCSPDVTPPTVLGCDANFDINSSLNCPFPMPDFTPSGNFILIVSDNCTPTEDLIVTQVPAPGTPIDFGPLSFELTVEDAAGNTAICTYNIMVNDVKTPTLSCPGEITIDLDNDCQGLMPNMSEFVTVSDNCPTSGEITVVQSIPEGTLLSSGETAVEIYVMQHGSRSPSCLVTINLVDDEPPHAECQPITIYLDANGVATLTPEEVDGGSTDNCGPITLNISKDRFECNELGEQIVTLTVTDEVGLSSVCSAEVNVKGPDADSDGTPDCNDDCPNDPNKVTPGSCGCGNIEEGIWDNTDIGNATGTAEYPGCIINSGTFRIESDGPSTSVKDKRHTIYVRLCDDAEIIAKVASINPNMQAGISFRKSLNERSTKVSIIADGSGLVRWEYKSFFLGRTVTRSRFRAGQLWLRIKRKGHLYIGYTSSDGVNWNFLFNRNLRLGDCPYIGLFAESTTSGSSGSVEFENVSVNGTLYDQILPINIIPEVSTQANDLTQDQRSLEIFPNPTFDNINLQLNGWNDETIQIRIFNNLGQVVMERRLDELPIGGLPINTASFKAGLYWLQVESPNQPTMVKRFIKN